MTTRPARTAPPRTPAVRCAIYTRKSSEEGLAQEFNSLDAQREAAESYIASQKAEGWTCRPEKYDDGGYTGGNIDRPALRKLMGDIEAGHIDCVVVYKVDRLSRSLLDFARIMETFDKHGVSFVSVTQHFNTTHSMGRLTLNILLSFAQFEREIIGERIRDKIAASRRRGKWTGGTPVLGYDVDRSSGTPKLVVNPTEAARVREIFERYLERGSLLPAVQELNQRGWRLKKWKTLAGRERGGYAFDKCNLHGLLTNVLYIGKIAHKKAVFDGEHEAIVNPKIFDQVQATLKRNGRIGGNEFRNRHGALLRRILHCGACGQAMSHTFSCRGTKRYRYYACMKAGKTGRHACATPSLPAGEIEQAVVDQIACITQDRALLKEVIRQATEHGRVAEERLVAEKRVLDRDLARLHGDLRRTIAREDATDGSAARVADLHDQVADAERRLAEVARAIAHQETERVTEQDVRAAFGEFPTLWGALTPREQARVVQLLVARVDYDAADSSIEVSFHAAGIRALAETNRKEEAA